MVTGSRSQRIAFLGVLVASLVGFSFPSRQTAVAQQAWSIPAPWSAQDIGNPAIAGSATFDQGTFTITAAGADIWGPSDQFTFVYQQVTGDVDVIARVDSITAAHAWSKAGVMIRSSLDANAAHGFALVSAAKGVAFQPRLSDGAVSINTAGPVVSAPYWVRLLRQGTTVTSYSSADGTTWSTLATRTVALGATAYVGIATTSHNSSSATTATISQLSITSLSLPVPQQVADIGSPAITGSTSYRQGVYSIHAGGADIWGTSDQFHFVYQTMTGDGEVVAHVQSVKNSHRWAKSGVMIRETLAPDSRHAFAFVSAAAGYAFQRRIDAAGISQSTAGTAEAAPGWVRLVRAGSKIDAYQSTDGSTWTAIGSDAVAMAETVYVGIATTSHNVSAATDAVVDNFKVTASGPPTNQPPTVAIASPTDGSTFTAGTDVTVTAAASDSDGTVSRVDFFAGTTPIGSATSAPYSATWTGVAAGTYSLTATAVDNDGASTMSAAVSVRVDPAPNQPPTVTLTAPANSATYTAPADISLTASAGDADGTITRVEFYNDATLLNTDTASPYAFTWAAVPAGTYGIRAVAYDDSGATVSSATATVTVNPPANKPPVVTLTQPANGASYVAPADVTLAASASDPDGTIARVEFYSGTSLLNSDTTAPYSFNWPSVPAGTYSLTAIAYDNASAQATSAVVTITVRANQLPAVTLTSPANGATFTAPASVTLSATASDADGTVAKVEFYNGTTRLNSDTVSPYSFTWSSVAAGTYTVKAIAYDNTGASTSSATSTITVNPPTSSAPTGLVFTASTDHATLVTSYELRIYASGADPNTATPIATSNLGKPTPAANNDISVDQTTFFSGLTPGDYVAAVAAIGSGGSSVSTGVAFTR